MKKALYLFIVLFIFTAIGFAGNSQKAAKAQLVDTTSSGEVFYFVYDLTEGWNFVSPVTKEMIGKPIGKYFPNLSNVYHYDFRYVTAETFELGQGYWLKNGVTESVKVSGTPITSVDYNLVSGSGNLVGAPFTLTLKGEDCVVDVQDYNSDTDTYTTNWTIEQGSAAWVEANGDCSVTKPTVKPGPSIGPIPTPTDPAPIIKPAPTTPISITMPTSKAIWRQGETHTIRWDAGDYANYMRYVKLMYNGVGIPITNDVLTLASGEYVWNINFPAEILDLIADKPVTIRVGVQPESTNRYDDSAPFIIKKSLSSVGPIPTATDPAPIIKPAPVITPDPGLVDPIFIYNLDQGWNFVSAVTEEMAGQAPSKYFPNAVSVYYHNGTQYQQASTFVLGQGYWLNNNKAESIKISGTLITAHKYNLSKSGWHLVGAPFDLTMAGVRCVTGFNHNSSATAINTNWSIAKGSAAWIETAANCAFARPGTLYIDPAPIPDPVPTPTETISVSMPSSGDVWKQGETHTIRWDAGKYDDYMRYVKLMYDGVGIGISNDVLTLASGEYVWNINFPTEILNLIADKKVKIRVGVQPESVGIYSDSAPFIIKKNLSDIGPVPTPDPTPSIGPLPPVADNKLSSPNIFALSGQADKEGPVNYDIYASFNRVITGGRTGKGVEKVKISLYFPTAGLSPIATADSCEINLMNDSNTCQNLLAVSLTNGVANNQALVKIDFSDKHYESLKFDITYNRLIDPTGFTVDIGDSVSNNAWGGDAGTQSHDSELQIYNTHLSVFGDDNTVGERRLSNSPNYVSPGDVISITVRNNYVEWSGGNGRSLIVDSPTIVPDVKTTRADDYTAGEISVKAKSLYDGKIETILSELKAVKDMVKEQETEIKYLRALTASVVQVNEEMRTRLNHFITYGVDDNTLKLGAGERAAVVYSFKEAFNKLPETEADLEDLIKISNGRWPGVKSQAAEDRAKEEFKKIYLRDPNPNNPNDSAAVVVMAYGLRQQAHNRNLNSEAQALDTYKKIFGFLPDTTQQWNELQAITYSGAERDPVDTDNDGLSDKMEAHYKTDPNNPDTDGDGYQDGIEVVNGHSPL